MENYSFDLVRIFFGELPPIIYLEILIRTTVLFGYMVFMLRIAPQRNIGQLSPTDLLIVIALGSAVGDPMFYPDVPIAHGIVVITLIIAFEYILEKLETRDADFEKLIEGQPTRLLKDGLLETDNMKKSNITHEDLFMELRINEYGHLGQIKRAYVETNGKISLIPFDEDEVIQPSVSVFPPHDLNDLHPLHQRDLAEKDGDYGCYSCGFVQEFASGQTMGSCPNCGEDEWYNLEELEGATQ